MNRGEILAHDLVKHHGDVRTVNGISFHIQPGEIYVFSGPQGAGKSTLISILTGQCAPTSGHATVGGYDVVTHAAEIRRIAGIALEEIGLDRLMKSTELLTIQGQMFGMSRRIAQERGRELLKRVRLDDVAALPVGKYSAGMRRRFELALALVHRPQILFLDEPTLGLDPTSRREVWAAIRSLNHDYGLTIVLTTASHEEAAALADRITMMGNPVLSPQP